ncbi:hypothetical protein [Texcoconibacillus texcoconensis]|uniref:DNA mismatch repair protein MutT n=1 Tax=Texcoconibacillus texcoconensis TaxID=1095777 RepID=A0A840QPR4_9BACI|nr:hypothetical protein [Texcoconibacillus texcoconensis]MBB5173349.1 hypothetical protein [Texcoconibacillus texcoconensis]
MNNKKKTAAGTDIEEVKRLNAQSGLSYNEAKRVIAKNKGFLTNNNLNQQ